MNPAVECKEALEAEKSLTRYRGRDLMPYTCKPASSSFIAYTSVKYWEDKVIDALSTPKITAEYASNASRLLGDESIRSAIDDVLANLGRFMDRDRVVRVEEFVDPDDSSSSVWLRVSCSVEETSAVHDAIDRFYSDWWWDRQGEAPIGILVGVGS